MITEDELRSQLREQSVEEAMRSTSCTSFSYVLLFPHETNMDRLHGVDFDKGCYVGQEVVSRMQHRGTARTRIVRVTLEDFLAGDRRHRSRRRQAGRHHGIDRRRPRPRAGPDRPRCGRARCGIAVDGRRPCDPADRPERGSHPAEADRRMSKSARLHPDGKTAVPVAGRRPVLHGLPRHRMGRAGV